MATRKRKCWNAGGIPGIGFDAQPKPPAPPIEHVPVTPATGLIFSPRFEDAQPAPPATDTDKPAATE
jgi:hypothetical protein